MLQDTKHIFSDGQSVFGNGTTEVSTNVIDCGIANPDMGGGGENNIILEAIVSTAFSGGTSIQAVLQDSADNSSFATLLAGIAVPVASAVVGKRLLQVGVPTRHRRYLRMAFVNAGNNTAGAVNAHLGYGAQNHIGA